VGDETTFKIEVKLGWWGQFVWNYVYIYGGGAWSDL